MDKCLLEISNKNHWEKACKLITKLEVLVVLIEINNVEVADALWSIAEGKTDYEDPKTLNQMLQDIRVELRPLLKGLTEFRNTEGLAPSILPDRLKWIEKRYVKND